MMSKQLLIFLGIIILGISAFVFWYINSGKQVETMSIPQASTSASKIRYIPIGDSYTIGNGVPASGRWPNVMVQNLKNNGLDIELAANPAVSGYTVQDAIQIELPLIEKQKPDFVTVLIGANDNFGQTNVSMFEQDLKELLDKLQGMLKSSKNVVLITIPDYSKSPAGAGYDTAEISRSIEEYNEIIKSEALKRGLKVADIFPISQTMTGADDYISDGLHPSAAGYAKWEKVIYPVVYDFLKEVTF